MVIILIYLLRKKDFRTFKNIVCLNNLFGDFREWAEILVLLRFLKSIKIFFGCSEIALKFCKKSAEKMLSLMQELYSKCAEIM